MRELTQTNLAPGNCWQTGIACILDLDIDALPPQHEVEAAPDSVLGASRGYRNVLNAYLQKHHGLTHFDLYSYQWPAVILRRRDHLLCGPTVRTAETRANHCVVARDGYAVWDPHPSRAGLTKVETWGVLGPATDSQLAKRQLLATEHAEEGTRLVYGCLCPECGLSTFRDAVQRARLAAQITQECTSDQQ